MFDIAMLIPILFPIIVALSAWLYHYLVQRSPANIQRLITQIAATAVPAIEQACVDMTGAHKKQTAYQNVQSILHGLHVAVPPQLVDLAIEAAVHELNLMKQWPPMADSRGALPTTPDTKTQAQVFIPSDIPPAA